MRILAIDFETANANRSSPCAIGFYMQDLQSGEVLLEEALLIDPEQEFSGFNIMIHGIRPEMVRNQPNFAAIYRRLQELIDGNTLLIAHNASFDIGVIRAACDRYGLPYPVVDYLDTLALAKSCYADFPSHRLDYLAHRLKLPLHCHHQAAADAKACFFLYESIRLKCNCQSPGDVAAALHISVGQLFSAHYSPCGKLSRRQQKKDQVCPDTASPAASDDQDQIFTNKIFVFSGVFTIISRSQATAAVISKGGIVANNLSRKTNFLVTACPMTGRKLQKAEKLIEQGFPLRIVPEITFRQWI